MLLFSFLLILKLFFSSLRSNPHFFQWKFHQLLQKLGVFGFLRYIPETSALSSLEVRERTMKHTFFFLHSTFIVAPDCKSTLQNVTMWNPYVYTTYDCLHSIRGKWSKLTKKWAKVNFPLLFFFCFHSWLSGVLLLPVSDLWAVFPGILYHLPCISL